MYNSWLLPTLGLSARVARIIATVTPDYSACAEACNTLSDLLPASAATVTRLNENVEREYLAIFEQQPVFTHTDGLASFSPSKPFYWAQQQSSIQSACYVRAHSAQDVATLVSVSRSSRCPLAIRGGGHSDIPGASNSPGGITLDLVGLDGIELVEEGNVARLGAGLTWGKVYAGLEKTNRTVVGGRLTNVGVGGLTLGGGLSHFSGLHGWACDNVKNYEVVLANTSIIQVSAGYHADLYRALRGGGNNFGVVTRFDVDTYAQGPMWGGLHIWSHTADMAAALTKAFTDFAHAAPSEPHASLFVGQGYRAGNYAYAAGLYNAAGTAFPPIFRAFEIGEPFVKAKIASTARVTMLSDLAEELDQSEPPGMRSRFTTATFKADMELQRRIMEIYMEEIEATLAEGLSEDERFAPMMGFQPLTVNFLQQSQKRGGNIMGLETEDAPLMVCSFGWEWSHSTDDPVVVRGIKNVLDRSVTAAKARGLYHSFKYANYAAYDQHPVTGYGQENVAFLKRVRKVYDPEGVFTTLVPGGFKIE